MRRLSFALAGLVAVATGCAAISGLGDYADKPTPDDLGAKPAEAGVSGSLPEASNDEGPDVGEVVSEEAGESDATLGHDAPDGEPGSDAQGDADAGPVDASADVDAAPPPCSSTCGGCCLDEQCLGGGSVTTCGKGGAACKDCTNMGGACGSGGSCATIVVDAMPPPVCSVSTCQSEGQCQTSYQVACCKTDDTCGCADKYILPLNCK